MNYKVILYIKTGQPGASLRAAVIAYVAWKRGAVLCDIGNSCNSPDTNIGHSTTRRVDGLYEVFINA